MLQRLLYGSLSLWDFFEKDSILNVLHGSESSYGQFRSQVSQSL